MKKNDKKRAGNLQVITDIARKVIVKMSQNRIPLTPENYLVWFEYFIKGNEDLERDIDKRLGAGEPFSEEINKDIYNTYFTAKSDKNILAAHQEIRNVIKSVFDEILITSKLTSNYGKRLKYYSDELKGELPLQQIRTMVKQIITDTDKTSETSLILQKRLTKIKLEADGLRQKFEMSERDVQIDPLTELFNRSAFDAHISSMFKRYQKNHTPFSVVIMHVDTLEEINTNFGEDIGKEVLQVVGIVIKENVKGSDFAARFSKRKFAILLQNTILQNAMVVSNGIRTAIEQTKLKLADTGQKIQPITASFGVVQIRKKDTLETLLERAKQSLMFAQQAGSNTVKSEMNLNVTIS